MQSAPRRGRLKVYTFTADKYILEPALSHSKGEAAVARKNPQPITNGKDTLVSFKISKADKRALKEASRIAGVSQTEFVLKDSIARAYRILGQTSLKHIEAHPKLDGGYRYTGRKLAVFPNYLMLENSNHSDQDWADLFGLPISAILEARLLCTKLKQDEYLAWRDAKLLEEAADAELYADE